MPPPLYVWSKTGVPREDDADEPLHVLTLEELPLSQSTPVASSPRGRFVTLGEAVDHDPELRDALLSLSPDPQLDAFGNPALRLIIGLAPVAWAVFVRDEWVQQSKLAKDAAQVLASPAFKEAEANPQLAKEVGQRRTNIERTIAMRNAYIVAEAGVLLAAIVVIVAGLRRWRAIPIAIGFGAAFWWLFQAGRPDHCFGRKAIFDYLLAFAGVLGGIAALAFAPGETTIIRDLRARLKLPLPEQQRPEQFNDVAATVGGVCAGFTLPAVMYVLGLLHVGNFIRVFVFVSFCTACFLVLLSWRRESSRIVPKVVSLALAAVLGFGVLAAADVGVRASFAALVEVQTCIAPDKVTALNKVQEQGSKETVAARKDTQADLLAFFITVFAAPLSEEMLYRGGLQRVARRAFGGRIAILISGVVFGIAHMGAFHAAFYQHIGLGLAFAAIFELAGGGAVGVVASAGTHLMWNLWLASMPVF